jgi:hypothetical protein
MSEPIELILNPNKQLLRLNCGQCGDTKDIILDMNDNDISLRDVETAVESILADFASKLGTEKDCHKSIASISRTITAGKIVKEVLDMINKKDRISVTIQDASDLTKEEFPEMLLNPVELIV